MNTADVHHIALIDVKVKINENKKQAALSECGLNSQPSELECGSLP